MDLQKNIKTLKITLSLTLLALYSLLFYSVLTRLKIQDFTSFYAALLNYVNFKNPYIILHSDFLAESTKLTANLNPPFVLFFFSFLAKFPYPIALAIWLSLSLILGLIGASIAIYYAFSKRFLDKYFIICLLIFLSFFSTLINISVGQMGLFLLFFIMVGYHFYLKKQDTFSGIFWGIIIAFKFFPALLFIYALKQRRFKVVLIMFITTSLALLLPYFIHDRTIYSQYCSMMSQVFWYGDNWNASLFGYVYRLFFNAKSPQDLHTLQQIIYLLLFFICLFLYLKNQGETSLKPINHQPFCLTLTMMLLMSPFGWLYYFPLLFFPLLLIACTAYEELNFSIKSMLIFLIALFLIGLPQNYINQKNMDHFLVKLFFCSLYFYGLIFLNYLCIRSKTFLGKIDISYDIKKEPFIRTAFFILTFFLFITALRFLLESIN